MNGSIVVVLVEPQGPANIGAVARVMMNFGCENLRLVNPQADPLDMDARKAALHALPLIERALRFATLSEALADCHFAVATTRRHGKYREEMLTPHTAAAQLAEKMPSGNIALVFGREDSGLLTLELDLCQRLLCIPTHEAFGSMNLAQAVTVCLYEFDRARRAENPQRAPSRKLAANQELEAMLQHMRVTLSSIDYLSSQNPDHVLRSFRHMFARAELDAREVRILQGLWSRIDYIHGTAKKLIP